MNEQITVDALREGLIEYIITFKNIYQTDIETINDKTAINDSLKLLSDLEEKLISAKTNRDIKKIRETLLMVEELIDKQIKETKKNQLTGRERALIARGYSEDDVIKLSSFTEEQARHQAKLIFDRITKNCKPVNNPVCIYLGGQPGCGKSSTSQRIKATYTTNGIVEIGIDNYRTNHPHYLDMEDAIRKHWKDRIENENDTPGNDIADFTHNFAGRVTDILIEMVSSLDNKQGYNIVMEWGMRTPEGPLENMNELKKKGYTNIVDFVAVHKDISYEACILRANIMNQQKHIIRRVPMNFHDLAVSTLPESCEKIYFEGYLKEKSVDQFMISNRNGQIVWYEDSKQSPKDTYRDLLTNPKYKYGNNDESLAEIAYLSEIKGFSDNNINDTLKEPSK